MAIVDAYLATIQGNGMPNVYPIPAPSRYQPINVFGVEHLQKAGLDNNGNICCHLSILLCFHRMQLLPFLCNSRIVASGNVLNWPALILKKMLEALPSTQSFCPYNFLTSWNSENRVPVLQMYDDLTILDSILDQIPFSSSASSMPTFTKFKVSYCCPGCGTNVQGKEHWLEKSFAVVPMLPLPSDGRQVSVEDCMSAFLNEPEYTMCTEAGCNTRVPGKLIVEKGHFTIVLMKRYASVTTVLRNKLLQGTGRMDILGNLLSVISRRGSQRRAHFVSYHGVSGRWFLNNDHHQVAQVQYHPFNKPDFLESPDLMCYKTN